MAATVKPVASQYNPKATFKASAAISGSPDSPVCVELTAEHTVTAIGASGASAKFCIGTVEKTVAANEYVEVNLVGPLMVFTAGMTIAAGDWVTPSEATANGVDVVATSGDVIIGLAIQAADANEPVGVILTRTGVLY